MISPVVATTFGYHIIRLDGRKPASMRPYEDVKQDLYAEAVRKAQQDERQKLTRELSAEGKGGGVVIRRYPESLRAVYAARQEELEDADTAEELERLRRLL